MTPTKPAEDGKVALIVGASGLIGQHLLTKLLASSRYSKVIALVRKPLVITDPKLVQWQINFAQLAVELERRSLEQRNAQAKVNAIAQSEKSSSISKIQSTLKARLAGDDLAIVDDVFCTLGSTIKKAGSKDAFTEVDYHYPLIIAKHFYRQNASLFAIVTAMAANESSKLFYNQVKGKVETSLRAIGYQHLGIFRPSMLSGQRDEYRLGEHIGTMFMQALAFIIPQKYQVIEAEKVARAMLAYADNPAINVSVIQSDQLQSH